VMGNDNRADYEVILVDYDEDLFAPPEWIGNELATIGASWLVRQCRDSRDVMPLIRTADVVMVQSVRPLLTSEVISQMEQCRCMVRLGIGYDSVDVGAATAKGILVCNIPTYCIDDVAEHALALMFDAVRHVARQDRWIRAGRWDRSGARHPCVRSVCRRCRHVPVWCREGEPRGTAPTLRLHLGTCSSDRLNAALAELEGVRDREARRGPGQHQSRTSCGQLCPGGRASLRKTSGSGTGRHGRGTPAGRLSAERVGKCYPYSARGG